jgi:broad specificity phosphatase PhoE
VSSWGVVGSRRWGAGGWELGGWRLAEPLTGARRRVPLSQRGVQQAQAAGHRVRQLLLQHCGPGFDLFVYTSPYLRCMQTVQHVLGPFEERQVGGGGGCSSP